MLLERQKGNVWLLCFWLYSFLIGVVSLIDMLLQTSTIPYGPASSTVAART